jgi:dTDP-4-dehydrorhamnose reductase
MQQWQREGVACSGIGRAELDLDQPQHVQKVLAGREFDLVINASGLVDVDACETMDAGQLQRVNVDSPVEMAQHCRARGAKFVTLSTDYVFSGKEAHPLDETATTEPCNAYGRSKLQSEQAVLAHAPEALVVRVSWLYGGHKPAFPEWVLDQARAKPLVEAVGDKWSCPTRAEDLCQWIYQWCSDAEWQGGILHLCNSGATSWADYAQEVLDQAHAAGMQLRASKVQPFSMIGFSRFLAERPAHTIMATRRFQQRFGIVPQPWQQALATHVKTLAHAPRTQS